MCSSLMDSTAKQPSVGQALPSLSQLLPGTSVPRTKGKVVLVDFWASWCGPCKASFPCFTRLHNKYASKGLVIIAIGVDEDFKKWMDENSKTFDFHLVYTDEPKRKGFKYEPWHYSFAPISIPMLTAFRSKNILQLLQKETFLGSEHFTNGFIRSYVQNNILDINKDLL